MGAFLQGLAGQIHENRQMALHHKQLELTGELQKAQAAHLNAQTRQLELAEKLRQGLFAPSEGAKQTVEGPRPTVQQPAQELPGPGAPMPRFSTPELGQMEASGMDRLTLGDYANAQDEGPRPQSEAQTVELAGPGAPVTTQGPPGPSPMDQILAGMPPESRGAVQGLFTAAPEHAIPLLMKHFLGADNELMNVGPGHQVIDKKTGEVKFSVPSEPRQLTNLVDQSVSAMSDGKYNTVLEAQQAGQHQLVRDALKYAKQDIPTAVAKATGLGAEERRQEFRPAEIEKETASHVKGQQEGQLQTFLGEKHDNWIDPTTLRPAKANQKFGEVYNKYTHIDDQQKPAMAQVRTLSNGLVRIEELGDKILRKRKGVTWKDAPAGVAQALNLSAKELAGDPDVEELQAILTQLTVPMAKLQGDTANVAVAERQMIGGSVFKKTDTIESLRAKTNNMLNVIENTLNGMGLNGTAYVQETLSKQSMAKGRGVASNRTQAPKPDLYQQEYDKTMKELESGQFQPR